jgi:hypothetical protein
MFSRGGVAVGICLLFAGACKDGTSPEHTGPTIRTISGGGVTDTVLLELRDPFVVEVRGPDGNLARGIEVVFVSGPDSNAVPLVFIRRSSLTDYGAVVHATTSESGRTSVQLFTGWTAGDTEITARVPSFGIETKTTVTVRPGAAATVAIKPRDSLLFVNRSYRLEANLVDRFGNAIGGTATFSSASAQVQVSSDGTVQGKSVGRAKIEVQLGTFSDSVFTSVVPNGAIALFSFGRAVNDPTGFGQANLDGSEFKWIAQTGVTGSEYAPENPVSRWNPGTGQLLYTKAVGQWPRLFVGDSTGFSRRLIDQPFPVIWETHPEISPDGHWIYFVARDSIGIEAIWRVRWSGGAPERVTTETDGTRFGWPTLSPDGTRMAYVASSGEGENLRAYVRDLASGVTELLGPNQAAGTMWSPTGEWILYAEGLPYPGHPGVLHLVRPDGTGDQRVVSGAAYLPGGTWSPDGRYFIAARGDLGGGGPLPIIELIDITTGSRFSLPYPAGWYGLTWRP